MGKIYLGSVDTIPQDKIIYPANLFGVDRNNTDDENVIKAAVLLQSLDSDNNLSNGIEIDETTRNLFDEEINISSMNLEQLKAYALSKKPNTKFKTTQEAIEHLRETMFGEITTPQGSETLVPPSVETNETTPAEQPKEETKPTETNTTHGSETPVSPNDTNTTVEQPTETNTTHGSETSVSPNDTNTPVEPVFIPLQASFDTTPTTLTYGEAQNYVLTQEANVTSSDGTPEVSYFFNGTPVQINDVLDLQVGDNNLTAIVQEQDGDGETNTTTKTITVLDPVCVQTPVEYAPIPTDPQRGDIFTPTAPTFEGEGNATFFINGTEVFANEPVELIANDINYTVQTQILPTVEGCGIQSDINTSLLKISTPLSVEASFYPVSTLYGAVNSFDTYAVSQADLNASVQTFIEGDNVSTQIVLHDENGTVANLSELQAGKNYSVMLITSEQNGTTPKTNETQTVNAGEISQPLPEIATPSISSTTSSSTTYTRTITVQEGLSLGVDGQNLGSGSVTFTVSTGTHTAYFENDAEREGEKISFSHYKTNEAPVAKSDSMTVPYEGSATLNVVGNDTDAEGDAITVTSVTQPTNGTVTRSGNSITYTPNAGFSGTDSYTYTINGGSTATVTVTVEAAPDSPTDFSGLTTFTAGPTVGLQGTITDADGITSVRIEYSDGAPDSLYQNTGVLNEGTHASGTTYIITLIDNLGNIKTQNGTLE